MRRTALIVEVPASRTLVALRRRLASDAPLGVPPHLTILYPFVPVENFDDRVSGALAQVSNEIPEFEFSLTHVGWFGESILWIGPEKPGTFTELTDAVVQAFPDFAPYEGVHDGSVPHVTVADSGTAAELSEAEKVIESELPLAGIATALTVLQQTRDGRWRRREQFAFAARHSPVMKSATSVSQR